MDYYKLTIATGNRLWNKYFIYNEIFLYRKKEVKFTSVYHDEKKLNQLKIQALNKHGAVLDQKLFTKDVAPNFSCIQRVWIIKQSILKKEIFNDINGITFIPIKIDGKFHDTYYLMSFSNSIDCVDRSKSVRAPLDLFSKLVIDRSKIPDNIDGFFLSNWNIFGKFDTIVNEKLKERLLKLDLASKFIIFDKIEVV